MTANQNQNLEQRLTAMIETLGNMIADETDARTRLALHDARHRAWKAVKALYADHPTLAVLYLQDAKDILQGIQGAA